VAKYADWLNFNNCTLDEYGELLGVLDEHCQASGAIQPRSYKTYSSEGLAVAPTRAAVDRLLADSPFGEFDKLAGTPDESYARSRPLPTWACSTSSCASQTSPTPPALNCL
jgi:hypothetical protein